MNSALKTTHREEILLPKILIGQEFGSQISLNIFNGVIEEDELD